eukprot:593289-Prorocentrum_lima.AAC.1
MPWLVGKDRVGVAFCSWMGLAVGPPGLCIMRPPRVRYGAGAGGPGQRTLSAMPSIRESLCEC